MNKKLSLGYALTIDIPMETVNFLLKNVKNISSEEYENDEIVKKVNSMCETDENNDEDCKLHLVSILSNGTLFTSWSNRLYRSICNFNVYFNLNSKNPLEDYEIEIDF